MEILPNELYACISKYLDINAKKSMRVVSPRWSAIIGESLRFNPILDDETWEWVNNLAGLVYTLKVRNLTLPGINKVATRVIFTTPEQKHPKCSFDSIVQTLLLNNELRDLIFECDSLAGISIQENNDHFDSLFSNVHLQNLVYLKVEFRDCGEMENVLKLSGMKLPNLKTLEIAAVRPYENLKKFDEMNTYKVFYEFLSEVVKTSLSLKTFKLVHFQLSAVSRDFDFNSVLHNNQAEYEDILKNLQEVQLEELSIRFSELEELNDNIEAGFNFGGHLMTSQTKLTVLDISLMNHSMFSINDPVNMTIFHNSNTLRKIKIHSGSSTQTLHRFFCPAIQICDHLEELQLISFIFRHGNLTFPSNLKKLYISGMASRLSEFEQLNWIVLNLVCLEELNMNLNWRRTKMNHLERLVLRNVLVMPNLKLVRFIDSNSAPLKKFFDDQANIHVTYYKQHENTDDILPRLVDSIEVNLNQKCIK